MEFKFGKLPAKTDWRTIELRTILKALPPAPKEYNADSQFSFELPTPMYANDKYGDCVIAGRAHLTLRFEGFEQGRLIHIADEDVTRQYFRESGGADSGLVMLDSLKSWRKKGWRMGARKLLCLMIGGEYFDIYAFAKLGQGNPNQARQSIYFLNGNYGGFMLPGSAMDQFTAGQPWDDVGDKNIVGGHCVTMCGYNETGPIGLTWARRQQITWRFYDKYSDEAYGIVDNRNRFLLNSPVDVEKLDAILKEIT